MQRLLIEDRCDTIEALQNLVGSLREVNAKLQKENGELSRELSDRRMAERHGVSYQRLLELDRKFWDNLRKVREIEGC
jgi:regulator of replication initiation timing